MIGNPNEKWPLDEAYAVITADKGDPFQRAKARALMNNYNKLYYRRMSERARILRVEQEFRFSLVNPETGAKSRSFDVAGKIDVLIEEGGQNKVVEHKTAGESIEASSDYWDRLTMDTQVSQYFMAAEVIGIRPETVIYDVIRKPMIQPTGVPEYDAQGFKQVVNPQGERVRTKDGKKWKQSCTEEGELLLTRPMTPEEYLEKLNQDIEQRPGFYFAQREIARRDEEILEYMKDAWAIGQDILARRAARSHPRNPHACTVLGKCEFFELCAGRAEVDGFRYAQRKGQRHAELTPEIQEGPRELLTASRIHALRRCPRLHYHQHEQPIERIDAAREALAFGSLIHRALEAWYRAIQHNQNL